MKRYVRSSIIDLKLSSSDIRNIENGLYNLIKQYLHDAERSHTERVRVSESEYDVLRYTARPSSGYSGMSAKPCADAEDRDNLNEFRSAVRKYLKQFGVSKVKFDFTKFKMHYGYVSGPDDFPMMCLSAIYFN